MSMTRSGLLRLFVVAAVSVKMQRQKSTVRFAQDMDDGSRVRASKSYRRAKDAERIHHDEDSGPPASKSLFQPGHHVD